MNLNRVFAAAGLLALSVGVAAAAPATVDRSTSVRSGPGTKYRVVARLPRGSVVDVATCTRNWCVVAWDGGRGYVAQTALAAGPAGVAVAPYGPYYEDYPGFEEPGYYVEPSYGYGVYAPGYYRNGRWWHRHGGGRGGWAGRPPQPQPQPPITGQPGGFKPVAPGVAGGGTSAGGGFRGAGPAGGGVAAGGGRAGGGVAAGGGGGFKGSAGGFSAGGGGGGFSGGGGGGGAAAGGGGGGGGGAAAGGGGGFK
jgi:SH3 domain-containing protein